MGYDLDVFGCLPIWVWAIIIVVMIAAMGIQKSIKAGQRQPKESSGSDERLCPHCAEIVKLQARVCKHCGRDLPAPFVIPPEYSLDQLPESDQIAIRQNSPSRNLTIAKRSIEDRNWHRAIGSLQAITMTADSDSKVYRDAYALLHKMLK